MRPQEDLFALETQAISRDRTFASARRIALDAHSWVEVVPGWMSASRILFGRLLTAVPWKQHDRQIFEQVVREPRLTAEYRTLHAVRDSALLDAGGAQETRRYC